GKPERAVGVTACGLGRVVVDPGVVLLASWGEAGQRGSGVAPSPPQCPHEDIDAVPRGPGRQREVDSGVEVAGELALRRVVAAYPVVVAARRGVRREAELELAVPDRVVPARSRPVRVPDLPVERVVVEVVRDLDWLRLPGGCVRRPRHAWLRCRVRPRVR